MPQGNRAPEGHEAPVVGARPHSALQRDLGEDVVAQVAQHSAGVGQLGAAQVDLVVRHHLHQLKDLLPAGDEAWAQHVVHAEGLGGRGGRRGGVVRRVGKLLAQSSSCGTCWALHRAYRFACSPFMAGFMELKHSERRQLKTVGSVVAEKVVKLTQNATFGRCCMNPDKFRNTNAYVDPAKFERAGDELRAPDQRLGGVPGLRGDAQDGPQQGLHERAHTSRRPHAAALQAHDGEGLLPPHEEALPEDEAALHGHRLRDGADLRAAGPAPRHAEANLNGATLFDVAGKSKDPKKDLRALSAAARAKAIEVMGQLGKLGDETFPRILEYDVQHPHGPARRCAQGEAQNQKKAVTSVRHLEYREVLEEGSERRAAFAQLRSRAHEIAALALQRQGLRPRRSQLAPAGTLAQPGAAGRLRSARLRALRPRDGVPRGAPASGARSDTAAAAEPLLGVDCRNRKKKIPSSRFLAFSIMRSAAAAQDDFLSGLPMRAGMASGEARRVGGQGRSLPCSCSDGPAASLRHATQAASRGRAARGRALAPAASHRAARRGAPQERERDNRNLRRRVDGLNNLIDKERERARERVEELERSNRILRQRAAHLGEILVRAHR